MRAVEATQDSLHTLAGALRSAAGSEVDTAVIEQYLSQFLVDAARGQAGRSPRHRKQLRDRALRELGPLLWSGGILQAVRRRGEAGTRGCEVLSRALLNRPSGENTVALAFDRVLLRTNALSALRARRLFFRRELHHGFLCAPSGRAFRILSFGSGPMSEILDFLDDIGPDASRVEASLLDGDPECLEAARDMARKRGFANSVRTHQEDPVRASLLGRADGLGDQDFVFSPGLFDFLPDHLAVRCLDFAFRLLGPSGLMVMAHYHRDLTPVDRLVMEWWLEWFPYFRTPKQIAKLFRKTEAGKEGEAAGIFRGPNIYLVVEKQNGRI